MFKTPVNATNDFKRVNFRNFFSWYYMFIVVKVFVYSTLADCPPSIDGSLGHCTAWRGCYEVVDVALGEEVVIQHSKMVGHNVLAVRLVDVINLEPVLWMVRVGITQYSGPITGAAVDNLPEHLFIGQ